MWHKELDKIVGDPVYSLKSIAIDLRNAAARLEKLQEIHEKGAGKKAKETAINELSGLSAELRHRFLELIEHDPDQD